MKKPTRKDKTPKKVLKIHTHLPASPERKGKTPKKVLKIHTHLPAIPDWLKINNSITFPLPFKSARELAKNLLDVEEDVEIELNFATGKKTTVEIKYEPKKGE